VETLSEAMEPVVVEEGATGASLAPPRLAMETKAAAATTATQEAEHRKHEDLPH
jgi:hypothetical protein